MKQYKIPVQWTMQGEAFVEAKDPKHALLKLANGDPDDVMFEDQIGEYEVVGAPEEVEEGCI